MRIGEILLLTTLAALGGVIVGVSIYFGRKS